jgi:hypothetical protein
MLTRPGRSPGGIYEDSSWARRGCSLAGVAGCLGIGEEPVNIKSVLESSIQLSHFRRCLWHGSLRGPDRRLVPRQECGKDRRLASGLRQRGAASKVLKGGSDDPKRNVAVACPLSRLCGYATEHNERAGGYYRRFVANTGTGVHLSSQRQRGKTCHRDFAPGPGH